ncbi:hypothetical protein PT974_07595 [Cladobotryum mycophilum]|uniref:Uncharacterized protein n=1 Tax=Cladobotryum mycophilum TaxID=491253 RepID=A0ABR0SPY0_9HYPO
MDDLWWTHARHVGDTEIVASSSLVATGQATASCVAELTCCPATDDTLDNELSSHTHPAQPDSDIRGIGGQFLMVPELRLPTMPELDDMIDQPTKD